MNVVSFLIAKTVMVKDVFNFEGFTYQHIIKKNNQILKLAEYSFR